ncbi:MAG: GAF domain-containing protein [Flavobacteriaceae bacterium]|nr:GAF domain-containing protein [Flavobacteriaceae bacterium]
MYEQLLVSVKDILNTSTESKAMQLEKICNLLKEEVAHYDWVGFYFHIPGEKMLELKAFAGLPTDHTKIPFGKGICGQVAVSNQDFIVPDVSLQDNYISCNINVKSEIVIPMFKAGTNIGQIDIDSNTKNAFSEEDAHFLKAVNRLVAETL